MNDKEISWQEFYALKFDGPSCLRSSAKSQSQFVCGEHGIYFELTGGYFGPFGTWGEGISFLLEYINLSNDKHEQLKLDISNLIRDHE